MGGRQRRRLPVGELPGRPCGRPDHRQPVTSRVGSGEADDQTLTGAFHSPRRVRRHGQCRHIGLQRAQVGSDIGGALGGPGEHRLACGADTGQHHQARQSDGIGARDVGVQPIADHQRSREAAPRQGVLHQRGTGLAGDERFGAGGGPQCGDHGTVPGQQSALGREGGVEIRRHPQRPGTDGQGRFGEIGPAGGHRQALHDGRRILGEQPHRGESHGRDLRGQRLGSDDEDGGSGRQAFGQQPCRTLGARHDVGGGGGETQHPQVLGDLLGGSRRVVCDEQRAGAGGRERRHRAVGRDMPAEHGAVQIQQQAIMLRYQACHTTTLHQANSLTRSSASVTPSTSAAAALMNHCSASSVRPSASSVSA